MTNCYICSGFIHNPDKKIVSKRTYHNQCWNRLDRKQKLQLESEISANCAKKLHKFVFNFLEKNND